MAGVRGEERGTGTEREAWVAGFFLINSSQRGEDRSQSIHAPAIYPPPPLLPTFPPPLTQSQRGRGGRVSQHVDPWTRGERMEGEG